VATLSTTTLPAGVDNITATYGAGGNFAASTSTAEPVTITAPPAATPGSYTLAANPTSLTIKMGTTANTTLTFTPTGGYSGTIALSCTNLPSNASCAFAQNSVTLSGNNQSVNMGLTIQTTAQAAGKRAPSGTPHSPLNPALLALAFWWPGGLSGLALFARKRKLLKSDRPALLCLLILCTLGVAAGLTGCGMSGYVANAKPAASSISQVSVVATGTSGTAVTSQTVTLTLNLTN